MCRTVLERRPAPERRAWNDGTAVWQPPNEKWQRAERQLSFSVTGMQSSFHSRDCRLMWVLELVGANATGPGLIVAARRMVVGVLCRRLPTGKPEGSLPITGETTLRVDSTQLPREHAGPSKPFGAAARDRGRLRVGHLTGVGHCGPVLRSNPTELGCQLG